MRRPPKKWKDIIHKGRPRLDNRTEITILLDRSGSMTSVKEAMETALTNFVTEHAKIPSTTLNLIQFDDINPYDVVFMGVPIGNIDRVTLKPRGNTPLNDAFASTIDAIGERYANMSESKRPSKVLFTVITDGRENASKRFSKRDVADRVRKQTNDYNWEFLYLGANQDTFAESSGYAIPYSNMLKWSTNAENIRGLQDAWISNSLSYTSGASASAGNYTTDQRIRSSTLDDLAADTAAPDLAERLRRYKSSKATV